MMLCNRGRFLIPPSLATKVRPPQILRQKAVFPPKERTNIFPVWIQNMFCINFLVVENMRRPLTAEINIKLSSKLILHYVVKNFIVTLF